MVYINLNNLKLKTFTEQDAEDYCLLNNLIPENIKILDLNFNKLKKISGIKLFKNLEILIVGYNKITNLSFLNNLNKLIYIDIDGLKLKSDQIKYINSCKKLKEIHTIKAFENRSVLNQLNKNIKIY